MTSPKPNTIYRHYKGNFYRVLALGLMEENLTEVVVYEGLKDQRVWVRSLSSWASPTSDGSARFLEQSFQTSPISWTFP